MSLGEWRGELLNFVVDGLRPFPPQLGECIPPFNLTDVWNCSSDKQKACIEEQIVNLTFANNFC